jgi:hypothetical protein
MILIMSIYFLALLSWENGHGMMHDEAHETQHALMHEFLVSS